MRSPSIYSKVGLFLPNIIDYALPHVRDEFMRSALADYAELFASAYRIFFAAAIALMVYFMFEGRLENTRKLLLSGLVAVFAVPHFLIPIVAGVQQAPIKEAALIAKQHDYAVVMWRLTMPSFNLYSERLVEKREPRAGDIVITKSIYLATLRNTEIIYQRNGIVLVRIGVEVDSP